MWGMGGLLAKQGGQEQIGVHIGKSQASHSRSKTIQLYPGSFLPVVWLGKKRRGNVLQRSCSAKEGRMMR